MKGEQAFGGQKVQVPQDTADTQCIICVIVFHVVCAQHAMMCIYICVYIYIIRKLT